METKLPCEKHEEQIITLFKYDETTNKRIDSVKIRLEIGRASCRERV